MIEILIVIVSVLAIVIEIVIEIQIEIVIVIMTLDVVMIVNIYCHRMLCITMIADKTRTAHALLLPTILNVN
jgi:hypothetical protein